MQLIDTRISENADNTTTVVFVGEGTEEVSVRMHATGLGDDAVLRAKAIMVQLTSFETSRPPSVDDATVSADTAVQ
jgi:hypothetical protein